MSRKARVKALLRKGIVAAEEEIQTGQKRPKVIEILQAEARTYFALAFRDRQGTRMERDPRGGITLCEY